MSIHYLRLATVGVALACGGCIVGPPPGPYGSYYGATPGPPVASPIPPSAAPRIGGNCREFQQSVTIDGRPQPASGWTCQQPDGSWQIATASPAAAPPAMAEAPYYPAYPYPYYAADPGYYYGPPLSLGFGFGGRGRGWRR